jgi:hypothetical protein
MPERAVAILHHQTTTQTLMKTTKFHIAKLGLLIFFLLTFGIFAVGAQPRNAGTQNIILPSFLRTNTYSYSGIDISMSIRNFTFDSSIPELSRLSVRQVGANIGAVWGNSFVKIRPRVGLFYSDGSVPHTIDMAEIAVAGNFYFMKKLNNRERKVEPYVVGNISYQGMKFFGTYLDRDVTTNYSVSVEKILGRVDAFRATAGIGGEIQLWSAEGQFVHLYSEVLSGFSVHTGSLNTSFDDTFSKRSLRMTIGVAVGIGKK